MNTPISYTVKAYARANAWVIDTQTFDNRKDAEEYLVSLGSGEGYWTELLSNYNGYSLCSMSVGI